MEHIEEQRLLNLRVQGLTIQQRQRIGAKISQYKRMIKKVQNISRETQELLLELIDYSYKEGFIDGLEKR